MKNKVFVYLWAIEVLLLFISSASNTDVENSEHDQNKTSFDAVMYESRKATPSVFQVII